MTSQICNNVNRNTATNNAFAKMAFVMGTIIYIACGILGLIFGFDEENSYDFMSSWSETVFVFEQAVPYWLSGIFMGSVCLSLGEMISLLDKN